MRVRGQFWINEGTLQPGESTTTHAHKFDHLTYVLGQARVEALVDDKVSRTIDKPKGGWVLVTAETWHRITNTGTTPLEYHCLFVPRHPETGEVEHDGMNGWTGAYQ